MGVRGVRRPSLRLVAASVVLGALGVALAGGATARLTTPAGMATPAGVAAPRAAALKPLPRLPDGCGDAPATDGRRTGPEILCGGPGNDRIYAGFGDIVKAGAGDDTIVAKNGGPNDIYGGPGHDTALIDPKWDRTTGIQERYTSAIQRPLAQAGRMLDTPDGFPYELMTVECDDNDDGSGRHIELLDPANHKPQMAAYDANEGVVDWQNVAWATVIYKWDEQAHTWNVVSQTDWLWDRTYDLVDFTLKKHPANVWHSFNEGDDDTEADQPPFPVTEPGIYTVRFRYRWFSESVPDPDLAEMPQGRSFFEARKVVGLYATRLDPDTKQPLQSPYCTFRAFRTGTYHAVQDGFTATWNVTVTGGRIEGTSDWSCCPGKRTDPLSGTVTGNRVVITRDCRGEGGFPTCFQTFTGKERADGTVTGTWSWRGTVDVPRGNFILTPSS